MRALTLTQPYAGLVASGIKLVENRPRPIIKPSDFGKPFAIHASREIDESVYDRIVEISPSLERWIRTPISAPWYRDPYPTSLDRVTSAVIAVATVDRVIALQHERDTTEQLIASIPPATIARWGLGDQLRWFFGPIGYVLRDVRALAEPVPCRGMLGFWTLTDEVASAVEAQLR